MRQIVVAIANAALVVDVEVVARGFVDHALLDGQDVLDVARDVAWGRCGHRQHDRVAQPLGNAAQLPVRRTRACLRLPDMMRLVNDHEADPRAAGKLVCMPGQVLRRRKDDIDVP